MQNIWVVSSPPAGGVVPREYHASQAAAEARVDALEQEARTEFESLDARVDLGVIWEEYRQIHDLQWHIEEVPDTVSLNPSDDTEVVEGSAPDGRVWVVLDYGLPEEGRGYHLSEEDARGDAWDRRWARWEDYDVSGEAEVHSFADYRGRSARYDDAPVDPGQTS